LFDFFALGLLAYRTYTGEPPIPAQVVDSSQQRYFGQATAKYGLRPTAITDPRQIKRLTAFFCWSAWASAAIATFSRCQTYRL